MSTPVLGFIICMSPSPYRFTYAHLSPRVLSIRGSGHKDLVCTLFGLMGARTYASGNERTVMRVNNSGNYGFKIGASDSFGMIVDLMNMASSSKNLYLTMVRAFSFSSIFTSPLCSNTLLHDK